MSARDLVRTCGQCNLYADLRGDRILAEIRKSAPDETDVGRRWDTFLTGYHDLHTASSEETRRALGRFAALMAEVTSEPDAVGVSKVNGSDARPTPPPGRPSASRSARPAGSGDARRHKGGARGGEPKSTSKKVPPKYRNQKEN